MKSSVLYMFLIIEERPVNLLYVHYIEIKSSLIIFTHTYMFVSTICASSAKCPYLIEDSTNHF